MKTGPWIALCLATGLLALGPAGCKSSGGDEEQEQPAAEAPAKKTEKSKKSGAKADKGKAEEGKADKGKTDKGKAEKGKTEKDKPDKGKAESAPKAAKEKAAETTGKGAKEAGTKAAPAEREPKRAAVKPSSIGTLAKLGAGGPPTNGKGAAGAEGAPPAHKREQPAREPREKVREVAKAEAREAVRGTPIPVPPAGERLGAPERAAPATQVPRSPEVNAALRARAAQAQAEAERQAAATTGSGLRPDAAEAGPPARTMPPRPSGPPLQIDHAITASELKVLAGGTTFKRGTIAGRQGDPSYNSLYYGSTKGGSYGVGIQVWYEPTIRDTRARYEQMKTSYPNVQETGNVTNYTFFAFWDDVYYLVYMGLKQRLVISVTASNKTLDPNQLFAVATKVRDRLIH